MDTDKRKLTLATRLIAGFGIVLVALNGRSDASVTNPMAICQETSAEARAYRDAVRRCERA